MLWMERVEALARVCWNYMTELNKIEKEGHEYAQRIDNGDPDVNIEYLKVLDRRRAKVRDGYVIPITKLLHKEGVSSMKVEDGLIKLTLNCGRELVFEEKGE